MSKRTLPEKLNDGTFDYVQVRQEEKLPDGRVNVALYERVPKDETFQYTPGLAYCEGIVDDPAMQRLQR